MPYLVSLRAVALFRSGSSVALEWGNSTKHWFVPCSRLWWQYIFIMETFSEGKKLRTRYGNPSLVREPLTTCDPSFWPGAKQHPCNVSKALPSTHINPMSSLFFDTPKQDLWPGRSSSSQYLPMTIVGSLLVYLFEKMLRPLAARKMLRSRVWRFRRAILTLA